MGLSHGANAILEWSTGALAKVILIIHNQFPGVELVSPGCNGRGTECYLSPDQKVGVGATTQVGFSIDPSSTHVFGVLEHELQGEGIRLIVDWEVFRPDKCHARSTLVEPESTVSWGVFELVDLYENRGPDDIKHAPIETYLMSDNRVLMTKMNLNREEECCKLEITISETSIRNEYTQRPQCIGFIE
jgi:hypothetical protein